MRGAQFRSLAPLSTSTEANQRAARVIPRFFEDYKKNEHKEVKVDEILGAEDAKKAIKASLVSAQSLL